MSPAPASDKGWDTGHVNVLTVASPLHVSAAPNEKMKAVLKKTIEEAKAMISKVSLSCEVAESPPTSLPFGCF